MTSGKTQYSLDPSPLSGRGGIAFPTKLFVDYLLVAPPSRCSAGRTELDAAPFLGSYSVFGFVFVGIGCGAVVGAKLFLGGVDGSALLGRMFCGIGLYVLARYWCTFWMAIGCMFVRLEGSKTPGAAGTRALFRVGFVSSVQRDVRAFTLGSSARARSSLGFFLPVLLFLRVGAGVDAFN